ncbi:MAG: hypothetical protein ACXVMS_02825 [Flavisolibacter sp.]
MRITGTFLFTLAFFVLFYLVLFGTSSLLPFTDLPNHLVEATIFKYGKDPLIGQYYQSVPGFYPNTFHTVFCSLFPSVEWGNRIFYGCYALMLPVSVCLVIRQLGGQVWYGLLSFLFIFNYNATWGFTGFTIAIPTLLFLFYLALLDLRYRRLGYTLGASLVLVLLYLMHAQMALFGLLLYGCMMLYGYWKRWGLFFLRLLLAVGPVLVLVVFWWMNREVVKTEGSTLSYLAHYYRTGYFQGLSHRVMLLAYDHMALLAGSKGLILAFFINALLLVPLFWFRVWERISPQALQREQYVYPLLLLLLAAGCFFLLPTELPGQSPLSQRFCTLVFLSLIILGAVFLKDVLSQALTVFVLVACSLYALAWAQYFYAFHQENALFRPAFFQSVPPRKILAGLMFDKQFRGRDVYLHFPGYHLVWNHGLTASKTIDYRFGVVRRGFKGGEIPVYQEWIGRNSRQIPAYHDSVHYLLVKEALPILPDSNLLNYTPVLLTPHWSLYRNNLLP